MGNLKVKANKLTEWQFNIPSVGDSKKPISVEVRLVSDEEGIRLRAICQDKLIGEIDDSDIKQLHSKVEAALNALGMGTKIEWMDYIHIQVHGEREDEGGLAAVRSNKWDARECIEVKAEMVKYGIHPTSGKAYMLDKDGYPRIAIYPISSFMGKPHDANQGWKSTFIPATPENLAAVEDICLRLKAVKARIVDFMNQENIQTTLQNLSGGLPLLENKPTTPKGTI